MDNISQEFIDFMEAQDNLQQWASRNNGNPPEYLINEVKKTQKRYEESKIPDNTRTRHPWR